MRRGLLCETRGVDERVVLGVQAIVLGMIVCVLLFVPLVVVSHRGRGWLGSGRLVVWGAALVYVMALWTYTVLPSPGAGVVGCADANPHLFAFVDDVRDTLSRPADSLTDPAMLQVLLSVLLFLPVGFFVRVLAGRGVVVALLVGAGLSAFIELTQLSGTWGLHHCAYRVFDVDDLFMNTLGAVIGSLLALAVPRRHRGTAGAAARAAIADPPRPVTSARRLLAMTCDVVGAWLVSLTVGVLFQLTLYALGVWSEVRDGAAASVVASVVPIVVWLIVVLATGRTVGDLAVQLRFEGVRLPVVLARFLRFAGGIGTYLVLFALPGAWDYVGWIFTLVSVILVFSTPDRRGLPGLLSGQRLVDAREPYDPEGPEPRSFMSRG